jgi:hypothetical protein
VRIGIATLIVASIVTVIAASVSQATPTQVNVRIEGKTETLFEGPIWTEGHDVQASSDTEERTCDATNNHQHKTPAPTPTAASVDAMGMIGETFDGQWYGGSLDDYFITRWGPDEQDVAEGAYWGILVNNVFTNVGGCQYELGAGDEVLWVYDAFGGKPFLALLPVDGDYTSGTRPLTATAELGKPFQVEVIDYADEKEDVPPLSPERVGSSPFEGADVSPVSTSAKGFEALEVTSPETVKTNAQGEATLVFRTPGWHRIKATAFDGEGNEDAIRSNRLDVCVLAKDQTSCGEPPAEDLVRTPPGLEEEIKAEEAKRHEEEAEQEAEIKRHEEESLPVGEVQLATTPGLEGKSEALISKALPVLGGPKARQNLPAPIGTMLAPYDDRWSGLDYRGRWRRAAQPGAWQGTVSVGSEGARVSARLSAGRPVFLLRGTSRIAELEVRAGSRHKVFELTAIAVGALRRVTAVERPHAGTVSLRVLKGTVELDGVAIEP